MKRLLSLCLSAGLAVWLAGCTFQVGCGLDESPYGEIPEKEQLTLRAEWPAYDPSVDHVTLFMENLTQRDLTAEGGEDLEVYREGTWRQVSRREKNAPEPGRVVPAGQTAAVEVSLSDYDLSDDPEGKFRIVKKVDGDFYAAQFTIGQSRITADTPYGFAPLENLTGEYHKEQAAADGCVGAGSGEEDAVIEAFFEKVRLSVPCQLRIFHQAAEGGCVVDVIYERVRQADRFLWRMRDLQTGEGGITERFYSFLVTDGSGVFLSDWNRWSEDRSGENTAVLSGKGSEKWVETVEALSEKEPLCRVWNQKGDAWAASGGGHLTFSFQTEETGSVQNLNDVPEGFERIEEIAWAGQHSQWLEQEGIQIHEGTLLLISNWIGQKRYYAIYDTAAQALQSYILL